MADGRDRLHRAAGSTAAFGRRTSAVVVVENADLLDRVLAAEGGLDLSIAVTDAFEGYDDRDDVLSFGEIHERGRDAYDAGASPRSTPWRNGNCRFILAPLDRRNTMEVP